MRKFVVVKPITDGETHRVLQPGEIIELSEKRIKNAGNFIGDRLEEVKEPKEKNKKEG